MITLFEAAATTSTIWDTMSSWTWVEWTIFGILVFLGLVILKRVFRFINKIFFGSLRSLEVQIVVGGGTRRKVKTRNPYKFLTKRKIARKLKTNKWVVLSQRDLNVLSLGKYDIRNVSTYDEIHKIGSAETRKTAKRKNH